MFSLTRFAADALVGLWVQPESRTRVRRADEGVHPHILLNP